MRMRTTTRTPSEDAAAMIMRPVSKPISIGLALALGLIAGCDAEKPKGKAAAEIKTRETMNKTATDVLKLSDALANGGVLAATNIEASDPLTQAASAKRTLTGKIGVM